MKETHRYDDIINLPHHVSQKRSRMSMIDRGAQFSPFAALVGFDAAIAETARLTEDPIELADGGKAMVDEKLRILLEMDRPGVTITHFRPDCRKSGGAYVSTSGRVKKVDSCQKAVLFTDGRTVPFEDIVDIEVDAPLCYNEENAFGGIL